MSVKDGCDKNNVLERGSSVSPEEGDVINYNADEFYNIEGVDSAGFKRRLKARHVHMILFGGGIGTGLWVSTGQALYHAGPAGILIAYTIFATGVFFMYTSIGEMTAFRPVHGGFIRQTMDYTQPAFATTLGLNFWFSWTICIPAEVTAAVGVVGFWKNSVPTAVWITIFLAILIFLNLFAVNVYGEVEFVQCFIKLLAILAVIVFMLIATCGGVPGQKGPIGFKYYHNPGPFANGAKGVISAFIQASFSMGGGEHLAVAAGETRNPRKVIKSAVYPLFTRMMIFFIVNIFFMTMNTPANDPRLHTESSTLASPFVIAIERAGNSMPFAHLINALILLTVVSCGNASAYLASRTLVGLSDNKMIPKHFSYKDKSGRPYVALTVSFIIGIVLCYIQLTSSGEAVYNWLNSLVALSGYLTWIGIFATHISFRKGLKAQNIPLSRLPFKDPCAPYGQWYGIVLNLALIGLEFWLSLFPLNGGKASAGSFFENYLSIPLFVITWAVAYYIRRDPFKKPEELDFSEARYFDEYDEMLEAREKAAGKKIGPHAHTWYQKVYRTIWIYLFG